MPKFSISLAFSIGVLIIPFLSLMLTAKTFGKSSSNAAHIALIQMLSSEIVSARLVVYCFFNQIANRLMPLVERWPQANFAFLPQTSPQGAIAHHANAVAVDTEAWEIGLINPTRP